MDKICIIQNVLISHPVQYLKNDQGKGHLDPFCLFRTQKSCFFSKIRFWEYAFLKFLGSLRLVGPFSENFLLKMVQNPEHYLCRYLLNPKKINSKKKFVDAPPPCRIGLSLIQHKRDTNNFEFDDSIEREGLHERKN